MTENRDPGIGSLASSLINEEGQRLLFSRAVARICADAWHVDVIFGREHNIIGIDVFAQYAVPMDAYQKAWTNRLFFLSDAVRMGEKVGRPRHSPSFADLERLGILQQNKRKEYLFRFERDVRDADGRGQGKLEVTARQGSMTLTCSTRDIVSIVKEESPGGALGQYSVQVLGVYGPQNTGWKNATRLLENMAIESGVSDSARQLKICADRYANQLRELKSP